MIFAYLILGHLLADYVFQPTKLVLYKIKTWKGTLLHSFIHFVTYNLILLPYLINGYYWLLIITFSLSFLHFWIDNIKINYDLKTDKKVKPFLIDQLLHIIAIVVAYLLVFDIDFSLPDTTFYAYYQELKLIFFISFIVFFGIVLEVYRFQKQREKDEKAKFKIHPTKIIDRIIVFSLIYLILLLGAFFTLES